MALRATVGLGTFAADTPGHRDAEYTAAKTAGLPKRPAQVRTCTLCCTHSNPSARSVKRYREEKIRWRVRKVPCINSCWLESFAPHIVAHLTCPRFQAYFRWHGCRTISGLHAGRRRLPPIQRTARAPAPVPGADGGDAPDDTLQINSRGRSSMRRGAVVPHRYSVR